VPLVVKKKKWWRQAPTSVRRGLVVKDTSHCDDDDNDKNGNGNGSIDDNHHHYGDNKKDTITDDNDSNNEGNNNNPTYPYLPNELGLINQFVHSILILLTSARNLAEQKLLSIPIKKSAEKIKKNDDENIRKKITVEKKFEFLSLENSKKSEIISLKLNNIKKYLIKARLCREKLRVIKLMNFCSDSGHTVLSWAASNGT
jgi:hypothetical protein